MSVVIHQHRYYTDDEVLALHDLVKRDCEVVEWVR